MQNFTMLEQIRENEKASHIAIYSSAELYGGGSWLKKPIRTVLELLPHFEGRTSLRVLDLGCGVGRNCIAIAQHFRDVPCVIDCVDILELAIEKLEENAAEFGVSESIRGFVQPLENFPIPPNSYDLILAVSALEHIDSREAFVRKLAEIRNGIRENGIVCLVVNSEVTERDSQTGTPLPPQFEVNLPAKELHALLSETFAGWDVLKSTVSKQQYDIPRGDNISNLQTNVVTYVARKENRVSS